MKIFKSFLILIIVSFLGLFFAYKNGYYEKSINKGIKLTNQKIKEFEKDLQDGKNITIDSYLEKEPSYATKASKLSLKDSARIEGLITESIKFIFRKLGNIIE